MKKYIVGAVLSISFLITPAFTQAAGLTTQQANSLIAVVQAAPGVPASAFVNLITAFSNITVNQATSLIAVVQAAPGVAPNAFVDLLISFTSDTTTTLPTATVPQPTMAPTYTCSNGTIAGSASQCPYVPAVQTSINVLYPTSGMTFTQGQPMTISWQSIGSSNAKYEVLVQNHDVNMSAGTFSPAQAHCDAADKCYITWTPTTFANSPVVVQVTDTSTFPGASGTSGQITILAVAPASYPVVPLISGVSGTFTSGINQTVSGQYLSSVTSVTLISITDSKTYSLEWSPRSDSLIGIDMPNNPAAPTGSYYLYLTNSAGTSKGFVVNVTTDTTTPPPAPTVTVTSPNGGETFTVGSIAHITWTSSNADAVYLGYNISSASSGSGAWIAQNIPNTGFYDWTVNVGNTTNTQTKVYAIVYKAGVGSVGGPGTATDYSDNYFTVLAAH